MQQRLALARAAGEVAALAGPLDLSNVPADRLPALDLPGILVRHAAAHVVAAVPLEPAARIVGVDPALLAPDRERLARIDTEEVERAVASLRRELCACKPALREFLARVGHVLAAEHAQRQDLCRRQLGLELRIEIASGGGDADVAIALLHLVVHRDRPLAHAALPISSAAGQMWPPPAVSLLHSHL